VLLWQGAIPDIIAHSTIHSMICPPNAVLWCCVCDGSTIWTVSATVSAALHAASFRMAQVTDDPIPTPPLPFHPPTPTAATATCTTPPHMHMIMNVTAADAVTDAREHCAISIIE
jgi:hypothetical protein